MNVLGAAGAPVDVAGLFLNLAVGCLGCAVVLALVLLGLQLALARSLMGGVPRFQQKRFVDRLRAEAFADPVRVVGTLSGNNAGAYLHHLWAGARGDAGRAAAQIAHGGAAATKRFEPVMEQSWPEEPLAAKPVPVGGGWSLVVVSLPPPERNHETWFVGIALPTVAMSGASTGHDAGAARPAVRFFQLDKWGGNRDTDFVEHTTSGRELTYNVGTEKTVEAFAAAVAEKLHARPPRHGASAAS